MRPRGAGAAPAGAAPGHPEPGGAQRPLLPGQPSTPSGFDPDDLRSLDDLRRLPFTTKDDLADAYPYGFLAVPLREVVRLHGTGGSGGSAIVMGYTRNDIKTWSNLMARMLVAEGVTKDDVLQITFDYGLFTGAFGVHFAAERLGASVIPISSGNTKRQIKIMVDYKTTALVSHAQLRAPPHRGDARPPT